MNRRSYSSITCDGIAGGVCVLAAVLVIASSLTACARKPVPGPDKQFSEGFSGAAAGAGAGAITGAQLTAGAGPGAAVGAGFGAVAGGIRGYFRDAQEESLIGLGKETREAREQAYVHQVIKDQLQRRAELHPQRDIYPSEVFFYADETKLRPDAVPVVLELARLNKDRFPYSRLVIASYVKADSEDSPYAKNLSTQRAKEIGDYLVLGGINPRRIETRPMIVTEPILIDPQDREDRYNQAIEFIADDR